MDPNGLRFWSLSDESDWFRWGDPPTTEFDGNRRSLSLASERLDPAWPEDPAEATSRLARVPQSIDQFGTPDFGFGGYAALVWTPRIRSSAILSALSFFGSGGM